MSQAGRALFYLPTRGRLKVGLSLRRRFPLPQRMLQPCRHLARHHLPELRALTVPVCEKLRGKGGAGFALVLLLWRRSGRADVDALGDIEE